MKKIFIQIASCLLCLQSGAQTAAGNGGKLKIFPGANFSVFGNFQNESSAELINDGNIFIRGNLSNNQPSMSPGSGILYLNGTAAQAINGTQVFKTFNLNTNNAAGLTLNNNLSVSGAHVFTSGNIASSANFLVYESGSSYSGANDGKSVIGWVRKIGATNFIFPVGSASHLRSIAISNLSTSSEFDATYSGTTGNTSTVSSPVVTVSQFEHWTISKQSGGTAQVLLNWDKSKVNFPAYALPDILSSRFAGSWITTGGNATGDVNTSGSILSNAQSTFGPFVIGSSVMVLPLHFLTVRATRETGHTTVAWKTGNEENVAWHEIQKSFTSNNFYTIGRVLPKNLKDQTYEIKDSSYLNGTAYYRIKSIDRDQRFSYSPIVSVTEKNGAEDLKLLTNPVKNHILISGGKQFGDYSYSLYAMDGRLVQRGQLQGGNNLLSIRIQGGISPGSYLLTIDGKGQQLAKKIILE
jgi:hypothetical protein